MTWAQAGMLAGLVLSAAPEPTPTASPSSPATTPAPALTRPAGPTYCAEWVLQTKEGYERLTLFADRMLVWKTSRDGKEDTRRKPISADETAFYCQYFARDEFFGLPADLRSGMTGFRCTKK